MSEAMKMQNQQRKSPNIPSISECIALQEQSSFGSKNDEAILSGATHHNDVSTEETELKNVRFHIQFGPGTHVSYKEAIFSIFCIMVK